MEQKRGKTLNRLWGVGAKHALYSVNGAWYAVLKHFPGALFDDHGYILFRTRDDYLQCEHLQIGVDLNVPGGISNIPGYVRHDSLKDKGEKRREELMYRRNRWDAVIEAGGPNGVSPSLLRQLGIYGGDQGIWMDKARTSKLTEGREGVTVSLLHTGLAYADDLYDDGVLYHYPDTRHPSDRDSSEIEATKAAGRLDLPVFVIIYPSPSSSKRDVHFGWVEDWDDGSKMFLITFSSEQPPLPSEEVRDDEPFKLTEKIGTVKQEIKVRPGQRRFRFRVLRRYSAQCAVCGISLLEVLDAAHIRPKESNGSDDPRNGLVLCAVHHRALHAKLFVIEPNTMEIHYKEDGTDADTLRISYPNLAHLHRKPHKEALEWLWRRWKACAY